MNKDEFLDHYDNDNQRFRDALDSVIKTEAVEFHVHELKKIFPDLNYNHNHRKQMKVNFDEFINQK